MKWHAVALALTVALGGCQYPRDPEDTLNEVTSKRPMRVGVTSADPWVTLSPERQPAGVEPTLVRRFAREIGAEVEWTTGSEEELFDALHERKLDLVIGGLTKKNLNKKRGSFTRSYLVTRLVVGKPEGADVPDDLEGLEVAVERGTGIEGLLDRETDATPFAVESLPTSGDAWVAADEFLLDDLGVEDAGITLDRQAHVMAVVYGENAFQVRLERFLLDRNGEVRRLLAEEARP